MEKTLIEIHPFPRAHVHVIGIGGASMSGLARILRERGYTVSGSDRVENEAVQALRADGFHVAVGHRAENVRGADLVVYSSAIPADHVERLACVRERIPCMERSELLGRISEGYGKTICVCGTHGKTTTTSMLAQILVETGADPSVHIGGVLNAIGGSVRVGESDLFLTEACEYRRSFLSLQPSLAVILNIDADHLDCYRDLDETEEAFGSFLQKLPEDGWALGNGEDPRVMRQLSRLACPHSSFGVSRACDYRMSNAEEDSEGYFSFDLFLHEACLGHVRMRVPGIFNAFNALAALAAAHHLGVDMNDACSVIGRFTGAHRRFEKTGELAGTELFHDYGHNPAEIRNAVSVARRRCRNGKLWAFLQPHTYSRVKALFPDYLNCTEEADLTLVTKIYGARKADPGDICADMLVDGMNKSGVRAILTPEFEDAAALIRQEVRAGDLVITLGCGDIYLLNDMLGDQIAEST